MQAVITRSSCMPKVCENKECYHQTSGVIHPHPAAFTKVSINCDRPAQICGHLQMCVTRGLTGSFQVVWRVTGSEKYLRPSAATRCAHVRASTTLALGRSTPPLPCAATAATGDTCTIAQCCKTMQKSSTDYLLPTVRGAAVAFTQQRHSHIFDGGSRAAIVRCGVTDVMMPSACAPKRTSLSCCFMCAFFSHDLERFLADRNK